MTCRFVPFAGPGAFTTSGWLAREESKVAEEEESFGVRASVEDADFEAFSTVAAAVVLVLGIAVADLLAFFGAIRENTKQGVLWILIGAI